MMILIITLISFNIKVTNRIIKVTIRIIKTTNRIIISEMMFLIITLIIKIIKIIRIIQEGPMKITSIHFMKIIIHVIIIHTRINKVTKL